jgi:hypothetical protein
LIQKEQDLTKANQQISQKLSTMQEVGHYKEGKKAAVLAAADLNKKAPKAKEKSQNPKLIPRASIKGDTAPPMPQLPALPRTSSLTIGKRLS